MIIFMALGLRTPHRKHRTVVGLANCSVGTLVVILKVRPLKKLC